MVNELVSKKSGRSYITHTPPSQIRRKLSYDDAKNEKNGEEKSSVEDVARLLTGEEISKIGALVEANNAAGNDNAGSEKNGIIAETGGEKSETGEHNNAAIDKGESEKDANAKRGAGWRESDN